MSVGRDGDEDEDAAGGRLCIAVTKYKTLPNSIQCNPSRISLVRIATWEVEDAGRSTAQQIPRSFDGSLMPIASPFLDSQ